MNSVVLAVDDKADDMLYKAIKGKVKELYRVGDCVAPRKAMDAIFDDSRIARMF